jgi:hypothetical protein
VDPTGPVHTCGPRRRASTEADVVSAAPVTVTAWPPLAATEEEEIRADRR